MIIDIIKLTIIFPGPPQAQSLDRVFELTLTRSQNNMTPELRELHLANSSFSHWLYSKTENIRVRKTKISSM